MAVRCAARSVVPATVPVIATMSGMKCQYKMVLPETG
jgi:hypothetical protein